MTHEDDPPNVFRMSPSEHAVYSKLYPSDGSRGPTGSVLGALIFPGGPVAIPKPTREALLLSAAQWATAIREHIVDGVHPGHALAAVERLEKVLAELKGMG